jgi:hypothetical protein
MLIENNMAALRREFEDAGVEFIDLGRTEVSGVQLESEMGRSEMRPSRLALYFGALLLPLNAAAQSPAFQSKPMHCRPRPASLDRLSYIP